MIPLKQEDTLDRKVLPIPRQKQPFTPELDIRDHREPFEALRPVSPPTGAPNILTVVLDDVGFGASSCFGGSCRMSTAERLAQSGLRYSRFHTTGLCSPTRQALLTGRNPHSIGMGSIPEMATNVPGYNSQRPAAAATIARILSLNGYATGAFGKMHQTPAAEISPQGPFERWPTGEGFDRFYGFLGAEADHFNPSDLISGVTQVDPPRSAEEGYHLSEDLVDNAINWLSTNTALAPERPWFCHLSFGACHAPLHVPEGWRERYAGAFDHGWDIERIRIFERQKALGVVPQEARLPPWPQDIAAWSSLSGVQRKVAARLMELFAAFAEHADAQAGRLIDHLERTGALDNTLIFYLVGDNGAAAIGGPNGTFNELLRINGVSDSAEDMLAIFDQLGGPHSFPQFPVAWALCMDTPYQWTKQVASHYGGTRNGLIVRWPKVVADPGGVRSHWHHVIDFVPTVLEAAGIPEPSVVDGVEQMPIHGVSFLYSMRDGTSEEQRQTQYFECSGNRGIYHKGWTAVTKHRTPWKTNVPETHLVRDDTWELYDTLTDWTQAMNVADEHPELLDRLRQMFLVEAARYGVLPLDDRFHERFNPVLAGRPAPLGGRTRIVFPAGMPRLRENVAPNLKNTSFAVNAIIDHSPGSSGVLVAQGTRFGGWSLYLHDGFAVYCYNFCGIERTYLRSRTVVQAGRRNIGVHFAYDGGGLGKGGELTLLVDGEHVGFGRLERSTQFMFSQEGTFDVGIDRGAQVTNEYKGNRQNAYNGVLHCVEVMLGSDAVLPTSAQSFAAALAGH